MKTETQDQIIGWAWNGITGALQHIQMHLTWPKGRDYEVKKAVKMKEHRAVSYDALDKTFSVFSLTPKVARLVLKIKASDAFRIKGCEEAGAYTDDGREKFLRNSPESAQHFADVVRQVKSSNITGPSIKESYGVARRIQKPSMSVCS